MFTKSSIFDLFGDLVVYRALDVVDRRLPRYAESFREMGLTSPIPPRKLEMDYARALAWLLTHAQAIHNPGQPLQEIIYLGDTLLNDGSAFGNLRDLTRWRGWCFIGSERDEKPAVAEKDGLYQANRWSAVAQFLGWAQSQGATLDGRTAVVVDIDKTLLGARGRNDGVIDRARLAAAEASVAQALGTAFDPESFRRAYAELNTSRYHALTGDNQDIVAYLCLMLSAGISTLEGLQADLAQGRLVSFQDFMAEVETQRDRLTAPGLAALHDDIYGRVREGDQTPFKAFRQREYVETVRRMGHLPDDTPLARLLVEEICITREVYEAALWLKQRGCLLLALSDKPDEATAPTADLVAQGYLPLHRVAAHVVGQSIAESLPD
ncbi:MAG: hypothetical protein ACUVR4_00590 [Anaerolineae bacterium]